jgi:predicted transposase/invertase (TIGR01784 family)
VESQVYQRSVISTGYKDGFADGQKDGRAEGRNEGRAEERINIARQMKARGFDISSIMELTGLAKEDIVNSD